MTTPKDRSAPTPTGRRRRVRDPYWDNIRYVSGTLVLFGHLTDTIGERAGVHWFFLATWALRVPVFVIVAGYFSTADALNAREARRLAEAVLVPYLAVGLLHSAELWLMYGDRRLFTTQPAWGMWFLLSLLFWRAALPYLAQLRHPLTVSVVAALVVGYLPEFGEYLSLSRTVCFLPFFLLGWKLRQGLFADALRARWSRDAALAVLTVTFTAAWWLRGEVHFRWLRMRSGYDETYPLAASLDWTIRGGVLLFGTVIALSFVRLIPRRRLPLVTYLGAGGMYIYLLHPLVLRPPLRWIGVDWADSWAEQAVILVVAVALSAVLGSPPVRRLARPVVQPRLDWLFGPRPLDKLDKNGGPGQVSRPAGH
ncbi:acyltransferase family protein [Streptomyces mayteni]